MPHAVRMIIPTLGKITPVKCYLLVTLASYRRGAGEHLHHRADIRAWPTRATHTKMS